MHKRVECNGRRTARAANMSTRASPISYPKVTKETEGGGVEEIGEARVDMPEPSPVGFGYWSVRVGPPLPGPSNWRAAQPFWAGRGFHKVNTCTLEIGGSQTPITSTTSGPRWSPVGAVEGQVPIASEAATHRSHRIPRLPCPSRSGAKHLTCTTAPQPKHA